MATVYVWNKYSRTANYTVSSSSVSSISVSSSEKLIFTSRNPSYFGENGQGVIKASDIMDTVAGSSSGEISTDTYMMKVSSSATAPYKSSTWYEVYSGKYDTWYLLSGTLTTRDEDGTKHSFYRHGYTTTYSKGATSYGTVESENRSAYPDNSYSGSYWYVYSHSYESGPEAYVNNGSIKQVKVYAGYGGSVKECDVYICKNGVITKV